MGKNIEKKKSGFLARWGLPSLSLKSQLVLSFFTAGLFIFVSIFVTRYSLSILEEETQYITEVIAPSDIHTLKLINGVEKAQILLYEILDKQASDESTRLLKETWAEEIYGNLKKLQELSLQWKEVKQVKFDFESLETQLYELEEYYNDALFIQEEAGHSLQIKLYSERFNQELARNEDLLSKFKIQVLNTEGHSNESILLIGHVELALNTLAFHLKELFIYENFQVLAALFEDIKKYKKDTETLAAYIEEKEDSKLKKSFEKLYERHLTLSEIFPELNDLKAVYEKENPEIRTNKLLYSKIVPLEHEIVDLVEAFEKKESEILAQKQVTLEKQLLLLNRLSNFLVFLAIAIIFITARYIIKLVYFYLNNLSQAVTQGYKELSHLSVDLESSSSECALQAEKTSTQSVSIEELTKAIHEKLEDMSNSSKEMSNKMGAVANSSNEMTQTIEEIAKSAENAASIVSQASTLAGNSQGKIKQLNHNVEQINSFVERIQEIAEQISLLSLNATIESARAGESGKGFKVVASEVKELAQKTQQSTSDIEDLIAAIKETAKEVTEFIQKVSSVIEEVNESSQSIASAVEEQSMATKNISENIFETSQGAESISTSLVDASASTQNITLEINAVAQNSQATQKEAQKTMQLGENAKSVSSQLEKIIQEMAT